VHAVLNVLALLLFVGSIAARRAGKRPTGVGLSTGGLAIGSFSAWLGGELVYRQGTMVNRTAWEPTVDQFQPVADAAALQEGALTRGELSLEGQTLPIVLLKRGEQILALSGTCSHWGGPLAEGQLIDDGVCVECPWHGSQFDLRDGSVRRGPATAPAPVFEARLREGQVEVRRTR
jgi:nitrite reductase/ring-hydroxylating ferredoxin subunit